MFDAGLVTEGKKGEQNLLPFVATQGGDSLANVKLQRLVKMSLILIRNLKESKFFPWHSQVELTKSQEV